MQKLGMLIICDRCGAEKFLEKTGQVEQDGGFTRHDTFEDDIGWAYVTDVVHARLCPSCASSYVDLIQDFFYKEEDDEQNSSK